MILRRTEGDANHLPSSLDLNFFNSAATRGGERDCNTSLVPYFTPPQDLRRSQFPKVGTAYRTSPPGSPQARCIYTLNLESSRKEPCWLGLNRWFITGGTSRRVPQTDDSDLIGIMCGDYVLSSAIRHHRLELVQRMAPHTNMNIAHATDIICQFGPTALREILLTSVWDEGLDFNRDFLPHLAEWGCDDIIEDHVKNDTDLSVLHDSLLHAAVICGRADLVKIMIRERPCHSGHNNAALCEAVKRSNVEIVEMHLRSDKIDRNVNREKIMQEAKRIGNEEILRLLNEPPRRKENKCENNCFCLSGATYVAFPRQQRLQQGLLCLSALTKNLVPMDRSSLEGSGPRKSFKTDINSTATSFGGTSLAAALNAKSFGGSSIFGSQMFSSQSFNFGQLKDSNDTELRRKKSLSVTKSDGDNGNGTSKTESRGLPEASLEVREIEQEYNKMEEIMRQRGYTFSPDPAAETEENRKKNRYRDVLPNHNTSVKIDSKSGCNKYINANHVTDRAESSKAVQKYICCQAPLPETFVDFWTMIWEQNCPVVVMLTRLAEQNKTKAHIYWPEIEGATRLYGFVMIHKNVQTKPGFFKRMSLFTPRQRSTSEKEAPPSTPSNSLQAPGWTSSAVFKQPMVFDMRLNQGTLASIGSMSNFAALWNKQQNTEHTSNMNEPPGAMIVRKFTLFDVRDPSRETRELVQLHYTEWPDRGVPETTEQMSRLIRELDIRKKGLEDPIVVHCSAGIGRTGTFLAIHMALQQVALGISPQVDIFETVLNLRAQRRGMVQSSDQYKFVYITIKDMLMDKYFNYNANTRSKAKTILNTSQTQVDHAIQTAPRNRPRRSASEPILEDCWKKIVEDGELMEKMKLSFLGFSLSTEASLADSENLDADSEIGLGNFPRAERWERRRLGQEECPQKTRNMGAMKQLKKILNKEKKVKLNDLYEMRDVMLGDGLTAEVFLARRKSDGQAVALKVYHKGQHRSEIEAEISTLTDMGHDAMVKLYEVIREKKRTILVLEYMNQGDLYDYIEKNGRPTHSQTVDIMKSLLSALSHLHKNNIAHRDIKLENIMINREGATLEAKLGDFGFASADTDKGFSMMCGSLPYAAPELVEGNRYHHAVDMWGLGVVLYILLSGTPPFKSNGNGTLTQQIKAGQYDFPQTYWSTVSVTAKDLVTKMLEVDPSKRITAEEALQHPFITRAGRGRDSLVASAA
ncbi:serine/threonine-protein kinase DCLK3 [Planoprotostelium fungivorum]|uniref:non-specific serine/threonine protein kinase n=1 Tax=Planoprotostelium fungivorum TaxID=1890364 RepID=A0A2P6NR81_9EUKA|nr:serine/threonine-protein kinase DCLK3 [Planoprotostelium fungivorum]